MGQDVKCRGVADNRDYGRTGQVNDRDKRDNEITGWWGNGIMGWRDGGGTEGSRGWMIRIAVWRDHGQVDEQDNGVE